MKKLPEKFYIRLGAAEHSLEVQRRLIALGYTWNGGDKFREGYIHTFIGGQQNKVLYHSSSRHSWRDHTEIEMDDLLNVPKEEETLQSFLQKSAIRYTNAEERRLAIALYEANGFKQYRMHKDLDAGYISFIKEEEEWEYKSFESSGYLAHKTKVFKNVLEALEEFSSPSKALSQGAFQLKVGGKFLKIESGAHQIEIPWSQIDEIRNSLKKD